MYHSTADSASETISMTDSDVLGEVAPTSKPYRELIASNRRQRPHILPRTASKKRRRVCARASPAAWTPARGELRSLA
jgi:hypothetical protein